MSNFTRRELNRVTTARKLYINLCIPGYKNFFKALEKNHIRDCPLKVGDTKRYLNMYGKEIAKFKGTKTRKKSSKIQEMGMIPLPRTLVETHNTE